MADMPSVGEAPKLIGDPVGTFYGWVSGFIPKGPLRVRFAPFCARLGYIYPVAAIFFIWAVSGHVGSAEAPLGLQLNVAGWRRGFGVVAIGFSSFALWYAGDGMETLRRMDCGFSMGRGCRCCCR